MQIAQLADQVKIMLISQLIRDMSRTTEKLLKYFSDTAISTSTVPVSPVLFKNLDINLNE